MKLTHLERNDAWTLALRPEARELIKVHGPDAYRQVLMRAATPGMGAQTHAHLTMLTQAVIQEHIVQAMDRGGEPFSAIATREDPDLKIAFGWIKQTLEGAPGININDQLSAQLMAGWQAECFRRAGRKCFDVSPGLAEQLKHTELHGLDTEDLQAPYRSLYIIVPPELEMRVWNDLSGWHIVEGICLTEDPRSELTFRGSDGLLLSTGVRAWRLLVVGASKDSNNLLDDALFHFGVALPPGKTLDQALNAARDHVFSDNSPASQELRDFYRNEWRAIFSWTMNVVMYATWPAADRVTMLDPEYVKLRDQMQRHPKGSHKYERARERFREVTPRERIILGRNVQRWTNADRGLSPTARTITVRTLVAGHWRFQAYGPGRKDRKRIWISPHWRGQFDAPESNPTRVLV